ncbi:SMI1/KNR4 family protein [Pilimelia columellifera]
MRDESLMLPPELVEAHAIGFDYRDGDGVDFEPYDSFLTVGETVHWWRAWTGNKTQDAPGFRVFGQDGTGGLAAFWLIRRGEPLRQQPVVFLGSEGEISVVACDLAAYLWLLAQGFGPYEASTYPQHEHDPQPVDRLLQIAQRYAPSAQQTPADIVGAARAEFPEFVALIDSASR